MSETNNGAPGTYKTLGVRLPNGLHSQAAMVAKLDGISLTDACVRGVQLYVEQKQSEPDFKARVAAELKKIEQEAAERRGAIESLFGPEAQAASAPADAAKKTTSRSPRAKS